MDHLLNWLWQGCVVALATSVVLKVLDTSRARFRYGLIWCALVLVLVLPLLPILAASLAPSLPFVTPEDPQIAAPIMSVPNVWWTSPVIFAALAVLWSAVLGARLAGALLALHRARRNSLPFPLAAESRLEHWNRIRSRGRRTRLVLSGDVRSAAVLGGGAPIIAIAPVLVGHLDADELDRVVIHEWAHVQRRDDLLHFALIATRVLAGWHPGIWWLNRQLQIEREAACDEIAVAVTGSAKGYAASLVKTAAVAPARRPVLPAVGALSAPGLRARIMRILSRKRFVSRTWSIGAATGGGLMLAGLAIAVAGFRLIGTEVLAAPLAAVRTNVSAAIDPGATTSSETGLARQIAGPLLTRQRTGLSAESGQSGASDTNTSLSDDIAPIAPLLTVAGSSPQATEPDRTVVSPAPVLSLESRDRLPNANAIALGAPPLSAGPAEGRPATPWGAAADAGVSVGKASQKAAVATAGFFARLGKKIAGAF